MHPVRLVLLRWTAPIAGGWPAGYFGLIGQPNGCQNQPSSGWISFQPNRVMVCNLQLLRTYCDSYLGLVWIND